MTYFKWSLIAAVLVTVVSIGLWAATDSHYYTKYEVVEKITKEVDPDDPFTQTGLYEGGSNTETVQRNEFHFGLLPTPSGLLDKHIFSVLSVTAPFWVLAGITFWLGRRHQKETESPGEPQQEGKEM